MPELPKFSEFVKGFTAPEEQFESMLAEAGFPSPPPGPMKSAASVMESIESAIAASEFPSFAPPTLPAFPFPEFGAGAAGGKAESLGEVEKVETGAGTRRTLTPRRFEVEIVEA